jgi:hypothetical protein
VAADLDKPQVSGICFHEAGLRRCDIRPIQPPLVDEGVTVCDTAGITY